MIADGMQSITAVLGVSRLLGPSLVALPACGNDRLKGNSAVG